MIKTYDEALKTLNVVRTYLAINRADDCVEELDKVARYFINEKHKENPTFEQCIKEWNEEGFQVDKYQDYLLMIDNYCSTNKEADEVEFNINLSSKQISMPNGCWAKLPFKIYHLLSKTIKALEVENDK